MWWQDCGCGVGGPARQIAAFSGAKIVGLNNNAYQVSRATKTTKAENLSHLVTYVKVCVGISTSCHLVVTVLPGQLHGNSSCAKHI